MADNTQHRGFAAMSKSKRHEVASMGGSAQGKENNPANFANDKKKAREAGKDGGQHSSRS